MLRPSSKLYIFYLKADIGKHFNFYKARASALENSGAKVIMLGFLGLRQCWNRNPKIAGLKVYYDISLKYKLFFYIVFVCYILKYGEIYIHCVKTSSADLKILKKLFEKRVKIIIDREGDLAAEIRYLDKHIYKKGFYDSLLNKMRSRLCLKNDEIKSADYVSVVTDELGEVLATRLNYPREKFAHLPMSFSPKKDFIFSYDLREQARVNLGLKDEIVFLYMGGAFYSWQNIAETIDMFLKLKSCMDRKLVMMFLVRASEQYIVKELASCKGLKRGDYIITESSHSDLPYFLSCADFGVMLRKKHDMNKVVTAGKVFDYLASGLPVIITPNTSTIPDYVQRNKFGLVIDEEYYDEHNLAKKITQLYDKGLAWRIDIAKSVQEELAMNSSFDYLKTVGFL